MRQLNTLLSGVLFATVLAVAIPLFAQDGPVIGVSWSDFENQQGTRGEGGLARDEAGLVSVIWERRGTYLSADAAASAEKQLADVANLIARDIDVLILLPQDAEAIVPAVDAAVAAGIPVIGYDRLIDHEGVYYLTFDNREIGRMQARALLQSRPAGNYVIIKGGATDPNSDALHAGQLDVLQPRVDSGDITVVGGRFTEGWSPENAEHNMREMLATADRRVDAILGANDAMAGGVIAALATEGMAGTVPVSGQGGDVAALNRIAKGYQTVSVWKDPYALGSAAAQIALALAEGAPMQAVAGGEAWTSPTGKAVNATFLAPVAITRDNLDLVVDARWVRQADLCDGVDPGMAPICR